MDKDALRDRMRSPGGPDEAVAGRVVASLGRWLSGRMPGTAAAYLAMGDEIDVAPLFERLAGWRWVLPRVEEDGTLTFRDRAVPVETHKWGMRQPVASGSVVPPGEIDLFLVPGLAFDRAGNRLGRGGGYYDRALHDRRADAVAVGVGTEARVVETVPTEEHDRPVDWLATETGVIECAAMRPPSPG